MHVLRARNPSIVEATVVIRRPIADVFAFYRDFTNLPGFLGDVIAVEQLGSTTSRWTVQGPLGAKGHWTTTVTAERVDELIAYETDAPEPLRTHWEVRFASIERQQTRVRESISMPFGMAGRVMLRAIGKPPAEELRSNLNRLKQLLETGVVTDTRHAVRGKFGTGIG